MPAPAIENVLAGLYARVNRILGISPEQFAKDSEETAKRLQSLVAPGVDATQSDLLMAELQQAHEALLKKFKIRS